MCSDRKRVRDHGLNDTNIEGAAHRATREEVVDRVNAAIKNTRKARSGPQLHVSGDQY